MTTTERDLDLDLLYDIANNATGRGWRWNQYKYGVPDLVATTGDPDLYEYETEVIEADHWGECGCRSACTLELKIAPQDAEFIAATGPDIVLALIQRIRDLEANVSSPNTDEEILAALNATVKPASAAPDLSYWGDEPVEKMRASLLAARQHRIEREAKA